jgi:Flp pilus assembly pilin Flp
VELSDQSGAAAIEYALFVALIAAVIIATVAALGLGVASLFSSLDGAF